MSVEANLSDRWREILDFERANAGTAGKTRAVRAHFGVSPARYYQVLDRLLDHPDAIRHDPALVGRLRRLREARRRTRFARRIGDAA